MKLDYVELAGFRGFRDKIRFELPSGFVVLSGRNGTGKSTLLDAIDFALTGTINKFAVKEAKGGGLLDHIWWVGEGTALEHYVSVGFIDADGERFMVTRSRERGCDRDSQAILQSLGSGNFRSTITELMQTTLIRDELISGLSLDLPEQARFAAVRAAIGGMVGPDYSQRTAEIASTASAVRDRQEDRIKELQAELGRTLSELTEARSTAERSTGIAEAIKVIESFFTALPAGLAEQTEKVRTFVAQRKTILRELESARATSQELLPEIQFVASTESTVAIETARSEQENASKRSATAEESLRSALLLEVSEQESDAFVAHMLAILSHGAAVGLQDGHCPLCDATRNQPEFEAAIARTKERLAARGERFEQIAKAVDDARTTERDAKRALADAISQYSRVSGRAEVLQSKLKSVRGTYAKYGFKAREDDPAGAQQILFTERENLVQLERALSVLEASNAVDRVTALEARVNALREKGEQEAARLAAAEKAVECARQIDNAAKTVANEILTEQFDTVMPLLRELYRRLRPHADWAEIESDFGGKVRGSLNFTVGDGHNPQFLFSSGQRRAAGLAFLLAVHLSRPWCNWRSLLMDDPVQHIDDYRALNLVEVLAAIRRTGRQVIVAVEDTSLANVLCRRLRSANEERGRHFELRTAASGTAEIKSSEDIYPMPKLVLRHAQAS